jgi:hypothetical protein
MDTQGNDFAVVEGAGDALSAFVGLQSELALHKLYDDAVDFAPASLLSPHAVLISVLSCPTMRGTSLRSLKSTA